ncbi:sister chromatid cohesion 1 protein 3 isoform X2 [Corylus avellana]|uniref:sister chromatid cohesion 1 protein 3 isoform X2 n=1 Tax=Corylus avellana TaxID=13451 RepID=UPI00286BB650|nr:sister chromatid cohesion 1 protein 3 isoform X2 [Corylus avellana]
MFYSQTYLARKGPLGTVWCAAHLQHRLRKSHYTSTDISSTVDRIMFPEVPIALRMSGHLLLGIVRIYSKKVEYLFQDCNVVLNGLRKAFASIDLNLPEDARQAPVQSITLPDKFDLDSLELDDEIYCDGTPDNHLRSQEEITLTDQIPFGRDHYVAISFDEDIMMMDSSHPEMVPNSDVRQMEEDIPTPPPIFEKEALNARFNNDGTPQNFQHDVNFRDADPSNQTEMLNTRFADDNISPDVPGREILRDAVPDFGLENLPPVLPDHGEDMAETNESLDQIMNEKDIISPIMEDNLVSAGQSLLFQQCSEPPPSAASPEAPEILDTHVSFSMAGDISPGLGIIRSTPPVQQPKARSRKRKQFDKSTVLTNKFMKKSLEDASDLLRKKRDAPCSALGVWKLNSILRKEQIFHQPSLTGLCMDLCDIFKDDYMSSKPHLVVSEEAFPDRRIAATPISTNDAFPEPRVPQSPAATAEAVPEPCDAQSPAPVPDLDMEIELPRNVEGHDGSNFLPEFVPSQARFTPSPLRRHDFSPATTSETGVLPTPDPAAFTGTCRSELERPMTHSEERLDLERTGFSDIPGLMNSAEADELYFLEADNNTPTGSQGMGGVDSLSVRSRAMAQYLRRHSPINPISEDLSEDLSLNKILEGKTRKICARMFFETLVLKSNGLVDVQQEEPYGDISLKLTPTLSKAEI